VTNTPRDFPCIHAAAHYFIMAQLDLLAINRQREPRAFVNELLGTDVASFIMAYSKPGQTDLVFGCNQSSSVGGGVYMQDYKSLCAEVMVNIQTHKHTDSF